MAVSLDVFEGFRRDRIDVGGVRLHVLRGGEGAATLLVGGWPQTAHAWRRVAPILAREHHVIIAEARGFGLSDKPAGPYDLTTVAAELAALMDALGNERFSFVGHDIGAWIGYALAADHPSRVSCAVLIDAAIPGVSPAPGVMAPEAVNNRVWHFAFNRLGPELNEALVRGREQEFFGWQFRNKAGRPDAISDADMAVYIDAYRDPDTLRAGFEYYRAIETNMSENAERLKRKLGTPILLVAGEKGVGPAMLDGLAHIGMRVTGRVLAGVGHYVPDEAPDELAAIALDFLARGPVRRA
jgi:pimeloyl-ACP methyl ester carboxylesterase